MLGHDNFEDILKLAEDKFKMAEKNSKANFARNGLGRETHETKKGFHEFKSYDELNSKMIQVHTYCFQMGIMTAIHGKNAAEVLKDLGGFKVMYPIVNSVVNSNLNELGIEKPSQILRMIFSIFNSFMNREYQHIEHLYKQRNLFDLLRYSIYKIAKRE
jgi:hypothetical protein